MPIGALYTAAAGVSRSYRAAQREMAKALARLGSQKRFQTASEDATGILRLSQLATNRQQYDVVLGGVQRGQAFIDLADAWVTQMIDQLGSLRAELVDADTAAANGYVNSINAGLDTSFGGATLNVMSNTFETVTMVDGSDLELQISAAGSAISGLTTVTGAGDAATLITTVDTALSNLNSYADKLSEFGAQVDSHATFLSSMISSFDAAESAIGAIDDARESARFTDQDIRQQAAVAMIAQGNISRRALIELLFSA